MKSVYLCVCVCLGRGGTGYFFFIWSSPSVTVSHPEMDHRSHPQSGNMSPYHICDCEISKGTGRSQSEGVHEFDKWHRELSSYVERSMLTSSASDEWRPGLCKVSGERVCPPLACCAVLPWHTDTFSSLIIFGEAGHCSGFIMLARHCILHWLTYLRSL